MKNKFLIPADVPVAKHTEYSTNYKAITAQNGNLMLFAADQKIEHLNASFYGGDIHPDAATPEHLFKIASQGTIGAFATHLGLIARYGKQFPTINYVVKLNGKTNIIPRNAQDPISQQLWSVNDIITFKQQSGLSICAIGYTIYLGSAHEPLMLHEAAQAVFHAHQHGLLAILWIYPRGKYVTDEKDTDLIAGAAGVAASLGADFVKVPAPQAPTSPQSAELLRQAIAAAGNTKLICSGGEKISAEQFLQNLYDQIHTGGVAGNATGRNIYQRSLPDAIAYTHAIAAIVRENKNVEQAVALYKNRQIFT